MSRSYLLRTSVNAFAGSFFDGWRVSTSVTPGWNVSRHLELGGFYNFNLISFPDRNQWFAAHIGRFRATISFDTRISTHIFAQYNSAFDSFSTNARFRFNFSEGNDLWIVYNEDLQTDRYRQNIPVPLSNARALMVKYTYTFVL